MLYFAYGSNMDRATMAARCPNSAALGVAVLSGWRFIIGREGWASIVPKPRAQVWGLLWDLAPGDMPALDRYEGCSGSVYRKVHCPVAMSGRLRRALVYEGCTRTEGIPRSGYMAVVVAAARAAGLPPSYIAMLGRKAPGARHGIRPPSMRTPFKATELR